MEETIKTLLINNCLPLLIGAVISGIIFCIIAFRLGQSRGKGNLRTENDLRKYNGSYFVIVSKLETDRELSHQSGMEVYKLERRHPNHLTISRGDDHWYVLNKTFVFGPDVKPELNLLYKLEVGNAPTSQVKLTAQTYFGECKNFGSPKSTIATS